MALDIAEAIVNRRNLIVEAGVGIGKSLGYLIPALYTIKFSNRPIIISTSSIQLTEQLMDDVKEASKLTGIPVKATVGKGKRNYSCKKRIFEDNGENINKEKLDKIKEWVMDSETGERADAPFQISNNEWEKVKVQRCSFEKCKFKSDCGFYKMRNEIEGHFNHKIIIVNQDLLIANLLKKSEGRKSFIDENYEAIIIDEAHNLEEKTRNALTESWNLKRIDQLIENLLKIFSQRMDYDENIKEEIEKTKKYLHDMFNKIFSFVIKEIDPDKFEEMERVKVGLYNFDEKNLLILLKEFHVMIQFEQKDERFQETLMEEIEKLIEFIESFKRREISNLLFWGEINKPKNEKGLTVSFAPKDIDKRLNKILFSKSKPVILTSATITQPGNDLEHQYSYIMNSIGFEGDFEEIKKSPFPYDQNSRIYIPNDISPPTDINKEKYLNQISERIFELINITEGRTLVLFTAKTDMDYVYTELINKESKINILKQMEGSNQKLIIKDFIKTNGVLLSTRIFWEGIDIPGNDLVSVIITRLPFPVPDPIIEYKTNQAKDKMNEILIPEMIRHLRQGAGRLIRKENDKGILSILDSRLSVKYGREYRESVLEMLPIKNELNNLQEISEFVKLNIIPHY